MPMPRIIVSLTLFLWLLIFLFAHFVEHDPQVALYPFIGCYPGSLLEGYHPFLINIWQASLIIIQVALATFGFYRNSRRAALAFLSFSLIFSVVGFVRVYCFVIPQISGFHK
jgi:hypothetical protein